MGLELGEYNGGLKGTHIREGGGRHVEGRERRERDRSLSQCYIM